MTTGVYNPLIDLSKIADLVLRASCVGIAKVDVSVGIRRHARDDPTRTCVGQLDGVTHRPITL